MAENTRVELVVQQYRGVVLGALVIIAVAASGAAVAGVLSDDTERVEVPTETTESEVQTQATVMQGGLWEPGTSLENKPIYVTEISPVLEVQPVTTVPADTTQVVHEVGLSITAEHEGQTFWSEREVLLREEASITDGEASSSAEITIPELEERLGTREAALDGTGSLTVQIDVLVEYEREQTTGTHRLDATLGLTESGYWLEDTGSVTTEYTRTEERSTRGSNPLLVGMLLAVAAGSAFGAHRLYRRPELDPNELEYRLARQRFQEWISAGRLHRLREEGGTDPETIQMASLGDLVDVAIDSRRRVIYDDEIEIYAVRCDGSTYTYEPEQLPEGDEEPDDNEDGNRLERIFDV